MNIAQSNVTPHRRMTRLLRRAGRPKRQDKKRLKKRGDRRRNGHLDSHLNGLWCDEVRLIGFPVRTRGHRELICVTPSALRSAKERKKRKKRAWCCCWSMVYLIPNLLLQQERPPPPLSPSPFGFRPLLNETAPWEEPICVCRDQLKACDTEEATIPRDT